MSLATFRIHGGHGALTIDFELQLPESKLEQSIIPFVDAYRKWKLSPSTRDAQARGTVKIKEMSFDILFIHISNLELNWEN